MADLKKLAQYLVYSYENKSNSQFQNSELKLQKLMYLSQKMSLALTNETLFDNLFEGWAYGPVLPELRYFFEEDYQPFDVENNQDLSVKDMYIIDNVIAEFGKYEAWALAEITHQDSCWIKSRKGLSAQQYGRTEISIEDMKNDAMNVRFYDHEYDMYIDEFDDFHGEVLSL